MAEIYITGHRNPDMDSVAAAITYSALKNEIDKENTYVPVVLGPLNAQSQAVLESLQVEPPRYVKDVSARVSSIYRRPTLVLAPDDPVYELVNMYNQNNPSVVPIMDRGKFMGLLSIDEINRYFLSENNDNRPVYDFLLSNIPRVIKGFFLSRGVSETFHAPVMVGAMDYKVFCRRLEALTVKPVLVVGNRGDHIKAAIEAGIPGLILTGMDEDSLQKIDTTGYDGFVYVSHEDTAETIRLLRLSVPVKDLLSNKSQPRIAEDTLYETAKGILSDSDARGLPVFDHASGAFIGFITRRCFLNMPRRKIIMVDHNEAQQSVAGIEDAEIVEIVDHHRLDAPKTRNPISIIASPVGSTCTIIYDQFQRYKVKPEPRIAKVLLAGISSDTVMLKSPTTTSLDRAVVESLCKEFSIDYQEFCRDLFSHGSSLSKQDPSKAVSGDFKIYTEKAVRFGIGQVEVTTFDDVKDVAENYIKTLESMMKTEKLEWAMLLVTNVMTEDSMLISTDYKRRYKLMYEEVAKCVYSLPGVLSRKKQLLPEVLRVLG